MFVVSRTALIFGLAATPMHDVCGWAGATAVNDCVLRQRRQRRQRWQRPQARDTYAQRSAPTQPAWRRQACRQVRHHTYTVHTVPVHDDPSIKLASFQTWFRLPLARACLLDEAEAPWRAPDCPQRQTRVDTCRADLRERGITRTTPRLWTRGAFWDLPTPTQDCVCLRDALRRQLPVVAGY